MVTMFEAFLIISPEGESTCKIICHAPNMEQLLFGEDVQLKHST